MNIKMPAPQAQNAYCLIKGYNTPAQRYMKVRLAAGSMTLLEVVRLGDASIFNTQDDAQKWLTAAIVNRPAIANGYQIMGFDRSALDQVQA